MGHRPASWALRRRRVCATRGSAAGPVAALLTLATVLGGVLIGSWPEASAQYGASVHVTPNIIIGGETFEVTVDNCVVGETVLFSTDADGSADPPFAPVEQPCRAISGASAGGAAGVPPGTLGAASVEFVFPDGRRDDVTGLATAPSFGTLPWVAVPTQVLPPTTVPATTLPTTIPTALPSTCLTERLDADCGGDFPPAAVVPVLPSPSPGVGEQAAPAPSVIVVDPPGTTIPAPTTTTPIVPDAPGTNVFSSDDAQALEDALRRGQVFAQTLPEGKPLVENEQSKLIVEVRQDPLAASQNSTEGESSDYVTDVDFARETSAQLRSDCSTVDGVETCDFDIDPEEPVTQAYPNLRWEFDITPRRAGQLELTLEIQPVLVIDGQEPERFKKVNKDIDLSVEVHPARLSYDQVVSAVESQLQITLPTNQEMVVDETTDVTALLSIPPGTNMDGINVDLTLAKGSDVSAVTPSELSNNGQAIERSWEVRAIDDGVFGFDVVVSVSAQIGDREVPRQPIKFAREITNVSPPPSAWERAVELGSGANILIAFITTVITSGLAVWAWVRRQHRLASESGRSGGESSGITPS